MKTGIATRISFAVLLALTMGAAAAESWSLHAAALKGASGIGMVKLFDSPPRLPGGSTLIPIAVGSADLMAAKVISGEYDLATLPINMAAKLYNSGIPIRLCAVVGKGMVSFLSSDPAIASIADLRGRDVQVAGQGATPDFLLRKLLRRAGIDPDKDLRLSYSLPYPEAAAALAAGKIESALMPEPFATLAISMNAALRSPLDIDALWKSATGQDSYPMTALVVSARAARDAPESVRAFLDAYRASIEWVAANPKAAGLLVEKYDLGLKAPIAEKAIPRSNYAFETAGEARAGVEALLSAFLEDTPASVGGKLPDAGFYASF
jgi:NitT/TauT family transport system substrate-binding protein